MLTVIDESAPEDPTGRVHYVVAAAALIRVDPDEARAAVRSVLNRQRPFHWVSDRGPTVRAAMIDCVAQVADRICVAVHYPTEPKGQELARERILRTAVLPAVQSWGTTHILIESRANQDAQDKRVVRNYRRDHRANFSYDWATKDDPLLWLADAVAGAVTEQRLRADASYIDALRRTGKLDWLPDLS